MPGRANLVPRPTAWWCHLAITAESLSVYSESFMTTAQRWTWVGSIHASGWVTKLSVLGGRVGSGPVSKVSNKYRPTIYTQKNRLFDDYNNS